MREHTSAFALRDQVGHIMEETATIFGHVRTKAKAEGMVMDKEDQVKVQRDVLKEVMIRRILLLINTENAGSYASGSVDAGLLATPQGYFGGDLDSLSADCLQSLMVRGYGVQDNFMDSTTVCDVYRELELLEFDGCFQEVSQQKRIGQRTDKIHWLTVDELDREKQPGLGSLCKKLISLPFELNKKCNLCVQGTASFQLGHFAPEGFLKRHIDGGYGNGNNGRKISVVYYPNKSWSSSDGGQLRMYSRQPNPYEIAKGAQRKPVGEDQEEDIMPLPDRIVLLRSRDMPHEVLRVNRKRFAVSMYIMGPPGPGDQPDGHYTPA